MCVDFNGGTHTNKEVTLHMLSRGKGKLVCHGDLRPSWRETNRGGWLLALERYMPAVE